MQYFKNQDFGILPARGSFTAAEVIEEWIEGLQASIKRSDAVKRLNVETVSRGNNPSPDHQDEEAPAYYRQLADDLAKVVVHLQGDLDLARLRVLNDLSDSLRAL
jgi:hypothetical protein